jgi:hypothetical protein
MCDLDLLGAQNDPAISTLSVLNPRWTPPDQANTNERRAISHTYTPRQSRTAEKRKKGPLPYARAGLPFRAAANRVLRNARESPARVDSSNCSSAFDGGDRD